MLFDHLAKWGALCVIVVQNAALIVVACFSRTRPGPQYYGSVAVLLTEVLKACVIAAAAAVTADSDGERETGAVVSSSRGGDGGGDGGGGGGSDGDG
eukprot:2964653-Pleurochrysis_carterae.AAC.1